jgi:uncharacterized membrane protein
MTRITWQQALRNTDVRRIGTTVRMCVVVVLIALMSGAAAVLLGDAVARAGGTRPPVVVSEPSRAASAFAGDTGAQRGNPDAWLPADFEQVMGYRPVVETVAGVSAASRADGGCSSPVGDLGNHPVGAACRAHDFGYDLLRYAAATGQTLDTAARQAVDRQFQVDMDRGCGADHTGCRLLAGTYTAAVWVNSVREGWGPPIPSSARAAQAQAAGLSALVGLAGLASVAVRRPRTGTDERTVSRYARLATVVRTSPGRLNRTGVAGLLLGAVVSFVPGLLPRGPLVQVGLTAVLAGQGYLLGLAAALLYRWVASTMRGRRSRRLDRPDRTDHRPWVWSLVAGAVLVAVTAGAAGQQAVAGVTGVPATRLGVQLALGAEGVGLALLLGVLAVIITGLVRSGLRSLRALTGQGLPSMRRVGAMALVPVLALGLAAGQGASGASVHPDTVVDPQQRRFLETRVPAAQIRSVTGTAATEPLRVYVPRSAEATAEARADMAVRELDRSGAFERSVLMLVTPTGTGWVNPAAVDALEYLTHGDSATVAVQYRTSSSFVAFFTGGTAAARAQAGALFAAVYRHWLELPAEHRPRLVEYGESLGALGGLEAPQVRAAPASVRRLWVGVPGPARHALGAPSEIVLEHPDDPVSAWSPSLLAGPNERSRSWLPVVSFWSATADLVDAIWAPAGHGHRYSGELAAAMAKTLRHDGQPPTSVPATARVVRNLDEVYASTS